MCVTVRCELCGAHLTNNGENEMEALVQRIFHAAWAHSSRKQEMVDRLMFDRMAAEENMNRQIREAGYANTDTVN